VAAAFGSYLNSSFKHSLRLFGPVCTTCPSGLYPGFPRARDRAKRFTDALIQSSADLRRRLADQLRHEPFNHLATVPFNPVADILEQGRFAIILWVSPVGHDVSSFG
jgi:hypothetical protein